MISTIIALESSFCHSDNNSVDTTVVFNFKILWIVIKFQGCLNLTFICDNKGNICLWIEHEVFHFNPFTPSVPLKGTLANGADTDQGRQCLHTAFSVKDYISELRLKAPSRQVLCYRIGKINSIWILPTCDSHALYTSLTIVLCFDVKEAKRTLNSLSSRLDLRGAGRGGAGRAGRVGADCVCYTTGEELNKFQASILIPNYLYYV